MTSSSIKLDFSRVRFCGRTQELKTLKKALSSSKATAVFIEGAAGSGKKTLVEAFLNRSCTMCCRGKFEQGRLEPFLAMENAVVNLFESLHKESPTWLADRKDFEDDIAVIKKAFPRVRSMFENENQKDHHQERKRADWEVLGSFPSKNQWSFERLRFALRSLFRTLSKERPVILFLADLQWSGRGSLSLIETLISDPEPNRQFLFIGTHRPIDSNHGVSKAKALAANVIDVHLTNLSIDTVGELVSGVLGRDDVQSLVAIVYRKTGGNAFFVIQFLRLLQEKGLLQYSCKSYQWEWEADRVVSETDISDNLLDIVATKISTMPQEERVALTTASCLGVSHFDVDTLFCAITPFPFNDCDDDVEKAPPTTILDGRDQLQAVLRKAVEDGYLEELGEATFKFVHDRVREVAYSLLPTGQNKTTFHLTTGRRMRQWMRNVSSLKCNSQMYQDRLLLQAVSQLNLGASLVTDSNERMDVAELNYRAAELAMRRSSFFPATDFLRMGVRMLGKEPWKEHPATMMKLMIALTRMEYCCGMIDFSVMHADEVISHASSFGDKKLVYHTKILCLMQQNKSCEAYQVVFSALEELGAPFPRRLVVFHIGRETIQTRRLLRGRTDEELLNLPESRDERVNDIAEYLERLGELCQNSANPEPELLALVSLRLTRTTIEHGSFAMTGVCFVAWGMLLAQMGNFHEAYRFGRIATQYAKQKRGDKYDARTVLLFLSEIYHWRQPYHEGVDPALEALQELWEIGTLEHVLMDTKTYLLIYYVSGLRLEPLAHDIEKYVNLLKDYKVQNMFENHVCFFQMVSNLINETTNDPVVLTGEFMDQEEKLEEWTVNQNDTALQSSYFQRMMLAYFFGDFELANEMSSKMYSPFVEGTDVWVAYKYFFQGLTALSLYRTSRKVWHQRQGMAVIKRFEKWVRQGVVNCLTMLLFLKAEKLAGMKKSKPEKVRTAFDDTITATSKMGILHIRALANERAGVYFVERGDSSWASIYLGRARSLYHEWGAMGKVRQMNVAYKSYVRSGSSSRVFIGGNLRSRESLGHLSTEQHKSLRV